MANKSGSDSLNLGVAETSSLMRSYASTRDEYKLISQILDKQPKILEWVHHDLEQLSSSTSGRGAESGFYERKPVPRHPRHATRRARLP